MRFYLKVFYLTLIFTQFACQQVSKRYCEDTNWRKEAFLLALQGENRNKINDFQKQCKPYKVEINRQAFNEGFDEGASQFCNSNAAIEFGSSGLQYNGTCENHPNESNFLKNFTKGRLSFLKNQLAIKKLKIEESDARLWRKKNEFELEANTNPALAVRAYDELESFKAENARLKAEIETQIKLIESLESKN